MLRKIVVLAIMLLSIVGMWFAFDSTRLAGSAETVAAMEVQITNLRFGYGLGILFGLIAGVMLTLTVKSYRT